jgi:hypothetical protein
MGFHCENLAEIDRMLKSLIYGVLTDENDR